jgi:uncharacterized protein YceH (UPF0502 family)
MELQLNVVEARILGSLMEKALSTPDYYPLSLSALVNACNQKSSRDPVVDYDEATVTSALDSLCRQGVTFRSHVGRVPKYEEHFSQTHQMIPKETALLCVLLLRGPQTLGELRGRSSRMYSFESLEETAETLENLGDRGLVRQDARLPGQKEARFRHLLGAPADEEPEPPLTAVEETGSEVAERLEKLELAVEALRRELDEARQAFAEFKTQFE